MSNDTSPRGVVAILTDAEGHVMATTTDFIAQKPGGFTLIEAQEYRAKRALAYAVLEAYCSPVIVKAIKNMAAEGIMDELVRNHGCKRTIIPVGHDNAE